MELYIGLMSGTSADGINAALVDFSPTTPKLVATYYTPYTPTLQKQIHALCESGNNEIERMGELDIHLGKAFANAANHLLKTQSLSAEAILAIGSHGQTIRHHPNATPPFSLQIGDPNIIAAETRITTIADFRRKDIALGGQGAPLVPAFHQSFFSSDALPRAIVNIGGIANITFLPIEEGQQVIGFDTGPGNVLMDSWIQQHQQKSYDKNGVWAAQGMIHSTLLHQLLKDPYFQQSPPKSTGREYFHLSWLQQQLHAIAQDISPTDVQATLTELSAQTIMNALRPLFGSAPAGEILICGGGAHNHFLMQRLHALATPHFTVSSTQRYGIDPDWVEAMAFAWLARQTWHRVTSNLPSVTGAKQAAILGGIYYA